jgi:hypothetical protein
MWPVKALYQLAERKLFNTLLRKILGCMLPILILLLVLDGLLIQVIGACRAGLQASGSPALLALLARADTAARAIPVLALVIAAVAFPPSTSRCWCRSGSCRR